MATPPPKSRSDVNTYSIEEKQQLLDNFDLEGKSCYSEPQALLPLRRRYLARDHESMLTDW